MLMLGEYWPMLPLGLGISTIALFFGLGGGILWMPVLLTLMNLGPEEAVVCTIFIQCFGQFSASIHNARLGLIDWQIVRLLAGYGLPAVCMGVLFSFSLHPVWTKLFLGLTIFFIAYVFLRGDDFFVEGSAQADLNEVRKGRAITAFGSVLTGFLGIGVGDWLVPFLNMRCRLIMARAVATCIALMFFLSVTAVSIHLLLGRSINWPLVVPGIMGVLIGAQLGSRLLQRVPETHFKELFVLMLVFIAAHVTFNAL
jgi:uncharacterized membrane protein YfcA